MLSHWSRSLQILRSDWWTPYYAGAKLYAIITTLMASKCPHSPPFMHQIGVILGHAKSLPYTDRIYYRHPYAIKTQRKAQKVPLGGGRACSCFELSLYRIRKLAPRTYNEYKYLGDGRHVCPGSLARSREPNLQTRSCRRSRGWGSYRDQSCPSLGTTLRNFLLS